MNENDYLILSVFAIVVIILWNIDFLWKNDKLITNNIPKEKPLKTDLEISISLLSVDEKIVYDKLVEALQGLGEKNTIINYRKKLITIKLPVGENLSVLFFYNFTQIPIITTVLMDKNKKLINPHEIGLLNFKETVSLTLSDYAKKVLDQKVFEHNEYIFNQITQKRDEILKGILPTTEEKRISENKKVLLNKLGNI